MIEVAAALTECCIVRHQKVSLSVGLRMSSSAHRARTVKTLASVVSRPLLEYFLRLFCCREFDALSELSFFHYWSGG